MSLAAIAAPLVLALAGAARQSEAAREAPASEGALDNDVFVPVAEPAAAALAAGDQALARARAAASGPPGESERQLDAAFDHWRNALAVGGAGVSTWLPGEPGPSGLQRLAEGLHAGLVRRLLALASAERARWSARHAPGAELALAALHEDTPPERRAELLAELLRLYPLTPAGARAALELGDLALEAGLGTRARGWYARCELEAELSGAGELADALRARRAALAPAPTAPAEAWQIAETAEAADGLAWADPGRRARTASGEGERWLRPGLAFLDPSALTPGHLALQTALELLLVALAPAGDLTLVARLRPSDYLEGYAPGEFEAPHEAPGWPLLPLADAHGVVLVVGRTREGEPNALLALTLELPSAHQELGLRLGSAGASARRAWAIVGSERLGALGPESVPELEELGDFEFQPGPVLCGDQVLVQARQFDGQVKSFLLAFDRRDGRLAWKRTLAAGADRVPTQRFAQSSKRLASQPLLAFELEDEARVFAGTHLGLGVLLDGLTGEPLWSFKNRRRGEREPGWGGERPALGPGAQGTPVVLWAPADSDRLYTLVPRPLAGAEGDARTLLAGPPAPLAEAQTLLGGDAREHLVLGRAGRERTVSARRAGFDRVDALDLGLDERFAGSGLASPQRAWVASNRGLYLFDRSRELYLLDYDAWAPIGGEAQGGDVYARGEHVLVLGAGALWSFRVR